MAIRKSSNSGIPFGDTAGRPANPGTGQLYSNGEVGRLELYTGTGWQNIVQELPGVAGAIGYYNQSENEGTFEISGTNFVEGSAVYAIGTNGVETQASVTTFNSIVQLTATFLNLSSTYEPYDIKVINPSNLFGLLPEAFYINQSPSWTTTAGSLGSFIGNDSVSLSLSASDPENTSLSYAVSSGSLPSGISLNTSSGLISGTAPTIATETTYSFSITASDGANTPVSRSFSITVVPISITGGTLASDSTYYYRTFTSSGTLAVNTGVSLDVLAIGGGGSGLQTGGGAGGILYAASKSFSNGSYSVVVGGGATLQQTTGANTTISNITAFGGGSSGPSNDVKGYDGGSGGGAGRDSGNRGLATQTSNGGGIGYGNNGGDSSHTGYGGGGGGGGAGAVGGNGSGNGNANAETGGSGGAGLNTWSSWATATSTGDSGYYAGGGASKAVGRVSPGSRGIGGGGSVSQNGYANTGGGGGSDATGGSGIVIVRYPKTLVGG